MAHREKRPEYLRLAAVDGKAIISTTRTIEVRTVADRGLSLLEGELRAATNALAECLTDAEYDTVFSRVGEVATHIALTPARTLAGLRVKASALSLIHFGDGNVPPRDFRSPEGRLYAGLLADLQRLDAGVA